MDMGIKLRHGYELFEFLERSEDLLPIRDQGMALRFLYGLRLVSPQDLLIGSRETGFEWRAV